MFKFNLNDKVTKMEVERYLLDKIKLSTRCSVPRNLLDHTEVRMFETLDSVNDCFVFELTSLSLGRKFKCDRIVEVPITWVDALLDSISKRFKFVKRWVNYRSIAQKMSILKFVHILNL